MLGGEGDSRSHPLTILAFSTMPDKEIRFAVDFFCGTGQGDPRQRRGARQRRPPPYPTTPDPMKDNDPPIPLEDFFEDIIAKTMRGRQISESELADRSGVPGDILARLCRGEFCDEPALAKVAGALGLNARALAASASKTWRPRPVRLEGVEIFNTPYRDMRVNACLVYDPRSLEAAAFDTGTDADPIFAEAERLGANLSTLFITHTHNDHIAEFERFAARGVPHLRSNREEPWPGTSLFDEGDTFEIGSLKVTALTTRGHSKGGTTYRIDGLERPVAVVGDAIFAGSMGGGMVSFDDAWRNNRQKILTLPDETVLIPGHGPATTVGEEKRHNPFFADEFE